MKKTKRKFKNPTEMLAFLAELTKSNEVFFKRHKIEMKRYDELIKAEEAIVAELDARYQIKSIRNGKKL